jgi:hypothetical protein
LGITSLILSSVYDTESVPIYKTTRRSTTKDAVGRTSNPTPGNTVMRFWTSKTKFLLNSIYKLSPYLTGNALHLRYKPQPVNAVYCENHTKHTDPLCGQNVEF